MGEEINPLVKPLITNGYFPLVLISAALYLALKQSKDKDAIAVVNIATCGVAASNILLIK